MNSYGQCTNPPFESACTEGNGAATNGITISRNQTYWFTDTDTFANGVNLNGGTLRVCGNLNLSTITFSSGRILIEEGGTLTINHSGTLLLNGNCTISNRGTLNIECSITMQNDDNSIFNATSISILNMNTGAQVLEINSATSVFINNGTANISEVLIQNSCSTNCVCLGTGSAIELSTLENNFLNSFNAPSGSACVRIINNAILNADLTGSSNVKMCMATGSTTSGSAGYGSASVSSNCTACDIILPIKLLYFTGRLNNDIINLAWATANETGNNYFTIEKSKDGLQWNSVGNVPGTGNSSQVHQYTFSDYKPVEGIQYYRLKQTDIDGRSTYSGIISIKYSLSLNAVSIFPNPNNTNKLNISGLKNDNEYYILELKDITGKLLFQTLSNSTTLTLPGLGAGIYTISILKNNKTKCLKYVVN